MKRNLGMNDRLIRLLLAVVVAILYYKGIISGTTGLVLGIVALVFALTSMVSFCPLYAVFGFSTSKKEGKA